MALRPFLRGFWDEPWEGMSEPSRLFDQYFGTLVPEEFMRPSHSHMHPFGRCPMRMMQPPQQTGVSEVVNTDKEFRVNMDVHHFNPEDITIKTKDNRVVVKARHEEKADEHGFIMREFVRQYVLPKDVDPNTVTSSLNKDGVLTLKAPKMALEAPKERAIPITHEPSAEQKEA